MNTAPQQVFGLPASWDSYIRHGWSLVPIPQGTKGPKTRDWNKKENCLTGSSALPPGWGVGLAHAYSGTMALDIDDWDTAALELAKHGINLTELYEAPDAVTINSGRAGRGKLIYSMPFGLALPSKKLTATHLDGTKYNYLDFRCATSNGLTVQDVMPPSTHPLTLQPYQWGGRGKWDALPTIPAALLTFWQSLLDQERVHSISVKGATAASWQEIRNALDHINPDISRDEWVGVGMALHHAGSQTDALDDAFALWDEWSSNSSTKYKGQSDLISNWRAFKPHHANAVTLGTLFHLAAQGGWQRPMPDITTLFGPIEAIAAPEAALDLGRVPPPELDFEHIPPTLRRRALEVGASVGGDPLGAVWAGLGAVSAVVDARTRLRIHDGWNVPPVLWLMTIGQPADRKTPIARPMLAPLKALELEDRPRYAQAVQQYSALDSAYAASQKAYLEAAKDPAHLLGGKLDLAALPQPMCEAPVRPCPLRFTVSDITSQKLVRMCAERPQGVLAHLDEMRSWMDKIANQTGGEQGSTWTQAYECDTVTMDRVGDGKDGLNLICDNFAVSLFGNVQPRVFKHYVKALSADGLLQRFIPAILREEYSDKRGTPIPEFLTNAAEYEQMLRVIHALPPMSYDLSLEAYGLFNEFQDWYHEQKRDDRILDADPMYMTALGKLEGTCGRLILMWHLLVAPYEQRVSGETAASAIAFVKSYVLRALRYAFGEVGGISTDTLDGYIAGLIVQLAGERQTITLSEIKRSARRRIEDRPTWAQEQAVRDAMDYLESLAWVKLVQSNGASTVWAIDPRLATAHSTRRDQIIAAKQRRYLEIHRKSLASKRDKVAPVRFAVGYHPGLDDLVEAQDDPFLSLD